MYQISDNDGPLFTLDSLQDAFRLATVGSVHTPVYVTNLDTGVEVMMHHNVIANITRHNHGQPNARGPVCTILNCGE